MWHIKWLPGTSLRQNFKLLPWKQRKPKQLCLLGNVWTSKKERQFHMLKKGIIYISMEFKRWCPVLECIIKCKFYVEGPIYNFEIARRKTTLLAQSKFFAFDDHKCCKFMQTLHYTWILTKSSFIWSKKRLILSPKHVFSNRTKWSTDVEEVFGQDSLIKRLHLYMFTSSLMSLEASFYVRSLTCEKYFSRLTSTLFASSNLYLFFSIASYQDRT